MKIETFVNFKLREGKGVLKKGIHSDMKNPFPKEIYEEIERNKNGWRKTLKILDKTKRDSMSSKIINKLESTEDMNTLDEGLAIETAKESSEKTNKRSSKRRRSITRKKDRTSKKK